MKYGGCPANCPVNRSNDWMGNQPLLVIRASSQAANNDQGKLIYMSLGSIIFKPNTSRGFVNQQQGWGIVDHSSSLSLVIITAVGGAPGQGSCRFVEHEKWWNIFCGETVKLHGIWMDFTHAKFLEYVQLLMKQVFKFRVNCRWIRSKTTHWNAKNHRRRNPSKRCSKEQGINSHN